VIHGVQIVPRRGSVVHRELVENVPSGFGGGKRADTPENRGVSCTKAAKRVAMVANELDIA
jgi:hypothetical protein